MPDKSHQWIHLGMVLFRRLFTMNQFIFNISLIRSSISSCLGSHPGYQIGELSKLSIILFLLSFCCDRVCSDISSFISDSNLHPFSFFLPPSQQSWSWLNLDISAPPGHLDSDNIPSSCALVNYWFSLRASLVKQNLMVCFKMVHLPSPTGTVRGFSLMLVVEQIKLLLEKLTRSETPVTTVP